MRFLPKSAIGKNTAWMFLGQGSGYILRAGYFIVLARLLGVTQYGIVVGAFSFVNLVSQYSRAGTGMVLLRYVSADHKRFAMYWGNVLAVTTVLSGILIAMLTLLAPRVLGSTSVRIVLLLAIASCFFEQLTVSATQVFQAFEKASITALFNQLTSLVRFIIAVGMLAALHHATALQWATASVVVSALAALIAIATVTRLFGPPSVSSKLIFQRAGEGLEYAFAASTSNAYDDLDKTMLSHYGMNAANGIYAMAYRIIEIATSPIVSVQLAVEPRLFKLGITGLEEAKVLGKRIMLRTCSLMLAAAVTMFLFAPVLPYIVGKGFAESVSALRWVCLIPLFRSVHYTAGSVLTCSGHQRRRTIAQLGAAGLNFGLNLWLIPKYSWHGAAWASLATDGSLAAVSWFMLQAVSQKRVESLSPKEILVINE